MSNQAGSFTFSARGILRHGAVGRITFVSGVIGLLSWLRKKSRYAFPF